MSYDPMLRLYQPASVRFGYDGEDRIAEYNNSGGQTHRFVHGPGIDEPLIQYTGSGLATRGFYHADERGSIITASDDNGNVTSVGRYDEYGRTQSFAGGRFGYAGKPYETLSSLYYSQARMYNERLGRFMQPDPIGYDDGMNMYAYVRNDPVNGWDPTGLCQNTAIHKDGYYHGTSCDGRGGNQGADWDRRARLMSGFDDLYHMGIFNILMRPGYSGGPLPKSAPERTCEAAPPSPKFMSDTTNVALASVPGGGHSKSLTSEFSRLTRLPNFRSGGWQPSRSSHAAQAYEHSLPGSDRFVKVYVGDTNFGGMNTVTITSSSRSLEHYGSWIPYAIGIPVNTANANDYWKDRLGCG